ncbi:MULTISPECIES: Hsp20/alpha crystallin family protein [Bacillus]|uniref:Hsp20/alpha crystallin family protein n=1 Tax=Bacillus TaxID=1386 RepID=UPI000BB88B54|nr:MULTISPECIES: Hsp20/alpha crystallin family protein [Bacillus]
MDKKNEMKRKEPTDPAFNNVLRSIDDFFQHSPLKGIVEQVDGFFQSAIASTSFSVETYETSNEMYVISKMPGVAKDQITIETFDKYLTISVKNVEQSEGSNSNLNSSFKSFSAQHSTRTIPLPPYVKSHSLKATYKDGLLEIIIPKKVKKQFKIED